jgi:hypothetical protein
MVNNAGDKKEGVNHSLPENSEQSPAGRLTPDMEKYRAMLDAEIPDEQADELLQTLWHIMRSFVDLGFGVSSVHYLLPDVFENASTQAGDKIKLPNGQKAKNRNGAALKNAAKEDQNAG